MVLTIEEFANKCVERLKDAKDLVCCIGGEEGSGKSSLAIQIALTADPLFDLEKNILYAPDFEELKTKILTLPPYSTIIGDEAIRALYKLNWQSKAQKYINILYSLCRQENKLSLLCIPKFNDLNSFFRQHRVKFWIQIIESISRTKNIGHAVVFAKSWNPFTGDAWNFKEMQKIIDDYSHLKKLKETEFSLLHKVHVLSKSRNYIGFLEFGKMPDHLFERYTQLKQKYAYTELTMESIEEKKNKREIMWQRRTKVLIKYMLENGKTHNEIGNIIGVTQARVSKMLAEDDE